MEDSVIKTQAAIEAILFSVGDAISEKELAKVLEIDEKTLGKIMTDMIDKYEDDARGIRIVKLEDSYQFSTKPDYFEVLTKIVNMPRKHNLTDSLMETLSIVAYKQPVTRQEIESRRQELISEKNKK